MSRSPERKSGVVTFLDVLGWKGVYDRNVDAISSLTNLIQGVRSRSLAVSRGVITGDIDVKSISDTIAIFTHCPEDETSKAIEIHGELCKWLIPESIAAELPIRGATSCGDFETKDNIFVGQAVDEAASWHEQSDWIGVNLTPTAEFVFSRKETNSAWVSYRLPGKLRLDWSVHCVDWTSHWNDRSEEIAKIKEKFRRLGPIVPEIAGKFVNTIKFIEHLGPDNSMVDSEGI